jgi:hypothetical protein
MVLYGVLVLSFGNHLVLCLKYSTYISAVVLGSRLVIVVDGKDGKGIVSGVTSSAGEGTTGRHLTSFTSFTSFILPRPICFALLYFTLLYLAR